MSTQNLIFNVLTFDYPKEIPLFYFSDKDFGKGNKIYKSIFPNEIKKLYPDAGVNGFDFIYSTFSLKTEGFKTLAINFETENQDFIKRFYNRQINYYFRVVKEQIVRVGFVHENQVWVPNPGQSDAQFDAYDKFSLKVQIANVTKYPELLVTYDGISKVFKKPVAELIHHVSPTNFKWIKKDKQLFIWRSTTHEDVPDYSKWYPVLNKKIQAELNIPVSTSPKDNRYIRYLNKLNGFFETYLNTQNFKEIIPLHERGFLTVPQINISKTSYDSNKLVFGTNSGIVPFYGIKNYKPHKSSPFQKIHFFFIFHKDDLAYAKKIDEYFDKGFKWFRGLYSYANVLYHTEKNFSISFTDKENPVAEIRSILSERVFTPDVKYIAIYLTPYSRNEKDKQKREIYYKIKEILLQHHMTSQVIDPAKMDEQGENWVYFLPNIAVAILAKLDGIPWKLNTPVKNELIVGVGAFKEVEKGLQYIGSAFSFSNTGTFNNFDYFMKHEIDVLAGKIANAVRQYATINASPDRLIIHFYKTMSEKEMDYIEKALYSLELTIPVFIISINKTESEDIVAFDKDWDELMPPSGTIINIGKNKYLLFNNTRYEDGSLSKADGSPFPIKLSIDCTVKEHLNDVKVIHELIDQVYQFSRMYWKSIRQQNLPVTIKYPEMVAQIAPHFDGSDIPQYGKNNLWFL